MGDLSNPLTRIEGYLAGIAGVLEAVPEPPLTRIEEYLKACYDSISGVAQTAAENLAAEYDPEGTYTAGDYVSYEGKLYKALADSAEPAGEWDPEDWDPVQVMNEVSGGSGSETGGWVSVPDEYITIGSDFTVNLSKVKVLKNLSLGLLYVDATINATSVSLSASSHILDISDPDVMGSMYGTFVDAPTYVTVGSTTRYVSDCGHIGPASNDSTFGVQNYTGEVAVKLLVSSSGVISYRPGSPYTAAVSNTIIRLNGLYDYEAWR